MNPLDAIALFDTLTPDEQRTLDRALAEDAALREALAAWRAERAAVRAHLDAAVPDRHLFVLYALGEDEPDLLDAVEQTRVAAARAHFEAVVHRHPGLHAAVRRIWADRLAFEAAWDEFGVWDDVVESEEAAAPLAPPVPERPRAADRAPQPRPRTLYRWTYRLVTAAAVVAFVAVSVFLLRRDAGFETIRTASGETRHVELADGSEVELGPDSELLVAEAGSDRPARTVRLRTGRALFDVVHGTEPFIVETASAQTTVLGTIFSVEADDQQTDVVLLSGAVQVASARAPEAAVRLAPGQRSRVVGRSAPTPPAEATLADDLAWSDTFYFRDTPMASAAALLSAHYGVRIEVDSMLRGEQVTGRFSKDLPLDEILQTLCQTLDCALSRLPGGGYRVMPYVR